MILKCPFFGQNQQIYSDFSLQSMWKFSRVEYFRGGVGFLRRSTLASPLGHGSAPLRRSLTASLTFHAFAHPPPLKSALPRKTGGPGDGIGIRISLGAFGASVAPN